MKFVGHTTQLNGCLSWFQGLHAVGEVAESNLHNNIFYLLDGIDGWGYPTAYHKPRLDSLSLLSWTLYVSHGYFEKVITFSLQLGIRHMNSRFEAYELNFRNPPKDLPNWEHIHLLEGPNVLYNHIPSLTLRCFGRRLLFPHKRKIFQVAGALSSHHPSCVGLNVMVSFI